MGGPTGGAGVRGTGAGGAGVGVAGFGTPGGSGAGVYGVGSGGSAGGQFVSGAGGPALALSHAAQPAYRGHISFSPVSQQPLQLQGGDLWFDGGSLKIRIAGAVRTIAFV